MDRKDYVINKLAIAKAQLEVTIYELQYEIEKLKKEKEVENGVQQNNVAE